MCIEEAPSKEAVRRLACQLLDPSYKISVVCLQRRATELERAAFSYFKILYSVKQDIKLSDCLRQISYKFETCFS